MVNFAVPFKMRLCKVGCECLFYKKDEEEYCCPGIRYICLGYSRVCDNGHIGQSCRGAVGVDNRCGSSDIGVCDRCGGRCPDAYNIAEDAIEEYIGAIGRYDTWRQSAYVAGT